MKNKVDINVLADPPTSFW